jgi:TonB family protein
MKQFALSAQTTQNKPGFSRTMVVSITCSVLVHLTALAYSYNWTFTTEKADQPFMVELIDAPVRFEESQRGTAENLDKRGEKQFARSETKVNSENQDTPSYLPTTGTFPQPVTRDTGEDIPAHYTAEATVSLDSQDVKYVSYLTKIKKKIEPLWHYPEPARVIGLQGKLAIRFSIVRDGQLTRLELLRSSGHSLLDEQALKAVRGAAPYFPLPEKLQIARLHINATFEYRISPYSMSTFSQSHQEKSL